MFFRRKTVINFYFYSTSSLINQWLVEYWVLYGFMNFDEIKKLNTDINVNSNKVFHCKGIRFSASIYGYHEITYLNREMITITFLHTKLLNNVRWFVFSMYWKLRNRHFYFHDSIFIICCMLRSSCLLLIYVLNALILCA